MESFAWTVSLCILWLGFLNRANADTYYLTVAIPKSDDPDVILHLLSDKFQEWVQTFGDSNCNQTIQLINITLR
ncbi:hypothetical protein BgiBS90_020679, partial [Biomphalaria glabrata]